MLLIQNIYRLISLNRNLSYKENRIFKIFNIVVLLSIFQVFTVGIILYKLPNKVGYYISLLEMFFCILTLFLHIKNYILIARFFFFITAILAQIYASLFYGEGGGFDNLFFAIASAPIFFFRKRKHYIPLFISGVAAFILVKYLYQHVEPLQFMEKDIYPYYWNIFFTSFLVFLGLYLFRTEHQNYEKRLRKKSKKIEKQKQEISDMNDNLHDIVEKRTRGLKIQHDRIIKYANIHAHDLRAPLTTLSGLIYLSKHQEINDPEEMRFFLDNIEKSMNELNTATGEITQLLNSSLWEEYNLSKELENSSLSRKN